MPRFNVEITDTFGGEANYCWVRRYVVDARSLLGAVHKMSRIFAPGWRNLWHSDFDNAYDLKGACVRMFIIEQEDL